MKRNPARYVCGIYTITNIVTGVVYVGQALDIGRRWKIHRWGLRKGAHTNQRLLRSWQKHGPDAFRFEIIKVLDVNSPTIAADLNAAEIEALASRPENFNLMDPGKAGAVFTPETRELLSLQRKVMWAQEGFREARSVATKALYADVEWKASRDAAVKEARNTPSSRAASSEHTTRLWENLKHRETQSAKRKENWADPAYAAQQSASRKAAWADPVIRERRSAAIRAAWARRKAANT